MRPYSTAGFDRLELTIDGVRTVAYVAGSGPAVVYLHGGGTFHGFEFAREWLPRFRVLLPYHPGFGESDDAPELATLQAYVRHYCTLLDRLGLPTIHLIGASLGGQLAAQIAIACPDRVRSLVLAAPAGITLAQYPRPDFSRISHREWPQYFVHDPEFIRPYWPDNPDESFLAERAREDKTTGGLLLDSAATAADFSRSLERIQAPTLLLWGSEDRMVLSGNAQAWQAAISNSTVKIVPHAGHLLLDESASARAEVARFLSESTT
jgi:pimeloyl-ACP methyl ester carboxylesterase